VQRVFHAAPSDGAARVFQFQTRGAALMRVRSTARGRSWWKPPPASPSSECLPAGPSGTGWRKAPALRTPDTRCSVIRLMGPPLETTSKTARQQKKPTAAKAAAIPEHNPVGSWSSARWSFRGGIEPRSALILAFPLRRGRSSLIGCLAFSEECGGLRERRRRRLPKR